MIMAINVDVLKKYPDVDEASVDALLNQLIAENDKKIVVLDDDPTGVQTVHDVSVFTNWKPETLREAFA